MSNKQSIPEEIGTMNPILLNTDPGDDRRSERSPSSNQIRVGSTTAISVITTSEVTQRSGKDVYKAIEFPSTTSREIRSETEVGPIDAVTLLNALCKTAELIGKGGLAYHDGRRLQETAAYFSRPEAQGLEANIPEAKGLIADVHSKVMAALFGVEKNMTEVISGIRKELQKINAPIMIEVDDKTNSTEYRGRVSARVIIPLDIK